MSHKLRLWGSAIAVASALCAVSSCSKKAENTAPPPSATAQSSPQPAPPPAAGTPAGSTPTTAPAPATDKMASATPPSTAEPLPAPVAAPAPPPPPPPMPETFTIPAGASLSVRTIPSLSTKANKTGDPFSGTLAASLVVRGVTIARKGSNVVGIIADSDPGGRVKGVASLTLSITSITSVDNQTLRVSASPFVVDAKTTKKKDAAKIGGAAAVGTVIGAIAGGGKGAAIGALAGGGAGTGLVLATRGDPAVLPSESVINVHLSAATRVTERQPGSIHKKVAPAAPVDGEPPPAPNQ
jgi:hypothetical protein